MTTAADLLDSIKRARTAVATAEAEQRRLELLLRDAKKAVATARKRADLAIEEALAERRQPSLFDAVEETAPQTYRDDKEHVPAGERHGNSPKIEPAPAVPIAAEVPTWRRMLLTETGWADQWVDETWAAVYAGAATVGELADKLLAGELFGCSVWDLQDVYAAVEMISESDEHPIKFPGRDEPVAPPVVQTTATVADEANAIAATKLSELDNFPDAAADALLTKGISTVETLMESLAEYRKLVPLEDLPLRNQLTTYLVADVGVKLKVAEWAAAAVGMHLQPDPAPKQPDAPAAPTPVGLGLLRGFPPAALKKLVKAGIRTLEELRSKADALPSHVDADVRMYAVIRGAGVASAVAREAANKVLYRPTTATAGELERASQVLSANPKPYGWDITYTTNTFETRTCHYTGTEAAARKKAMMRPNAKEVTECRGMSERDYVRAFGRGKM